MYKAGGSSKQWNKQNEQRSLLGRALPPVRLSLADHNLRSAMCSLIACIGHTQSDNFRLDSLLFFAMPLRRTGLRPPFRAQRERVACLGASSLFYGYSLRLRHAIVVHLVLCLFDFGCMWTSSLVATCLICI